MNTGFYVLQSKCAEDGEVAVATSQATLNSLPPRQRSHIREEVLSIGREEIKADDVADDLCKKRRTVKKETTPKVSTSISARAAPVKDASVCIDGFGWGGLGGKKPSAAMIGIAYGNLRRCFAGLREDKREEINPGGTKFPSMNMSGLCLGEACGYFPSLTAAKKSGYEYVAGACGQPKSSSGSSAGPVYQANLTGDDCKIIGDANAKNVCLVAGSSEGAKCAALARSRGATAGGAVPQYILITEGADSSILPTPFSVAASKYANGECGAIIGSGIELNASARVLSYYWENQVKLAVSLGGIEPPVFACKDRSTAVDFSARFERFASQMESCSVNTSWKVACELTGFSTRRCIAVTPKV